MTKDVRMDDEPFDRLTNLANVMTAALEDAIEVEHEETRGTDLNFSEVKGIIMLSDATSGGIEMFGYEDMADAMASLFIHLRAMFEAQGKTLRVMTNDGTVLLDASNG